MRDIYIITSKHSTKTTIARHNPQYPVMQILDHGKWVNVGMFSRDWVITAKLKTK